MKKIFENWKKFLVEAVSFEEIMDEASFNTLTAMAVFLMSQSTSNKATLNMNLV